jgi:hypothetical protein
MVNRGPDFRVRYRIRKFFSLLLPPFTGGKIVSGPSPVYFLIRGLFSSGSVREAFGEASGFPEAFPKKPRRNPEDNPAGIRPEILPGMAAKLLQNSRKKNSRIRYRTLKFCFRAPPYLRGRAPYLSMVQRIRFYL